MNFTCPHCGFIQIVTTAAADQGTIFLDVGNFAEASNVRQNPMLSVTCHAVKCANLDCAKLSVAFDLALGQKSASGDRRLEDTNFKSARVYPSATGMPFPEGVPEAMLEDYNEAWAIIELSPKSSATLARRCLQAMIRDFCGIQERTLYNEIEKLEKQLKDDTLPKGVEPETVAAMKVLKDIGNIGAHMTVENGKIVEVDPDEARKLLGLIEMLFSDWYVARHRRQARLASIEAMAAPTTVKASENET